MRGLVLHLVKQGGPERAAAPPSPLLAVPNVTAHPSTTSVPITVLLYDGPLLCGFNVAIGGLNGDTTRGCSDCGAKQQARCLGLVGLLYAVLQLSRQQLIV